MRDQGGESRKQLVGTTRETLWQKMRMNRGHCKK